MRGWERQEGGLSGRIRMTFGLTAVLLVGAILLGGGARAGYVGDVILQLIAVALLLLTIRDALVQGSWRWAPVLPLVVVSLTAVLQLMPLPLGPHFSLAVDGFPQGATWRSLTVTPQATFAAFLSFLVPVAVFAGAVQLDWHARLRLLGLLVAAIVVSLVVGLLQVAQGPDSGFRFFEHSNPTDAVGFFANRNHFAALLYVGIVMVGAWLVAATLRLLRSRAMATADLVRVALGAVLLIALIGGLAIARSRAGLVLAMAALLGVSVLVVVAGRSVGKAAAGGRSRQLMAAIIAGSVLIVGQFGITRMVRRFESDPLEDLRFAFAATTWDAALAALPLGTGLGSFVPVYATREKDTDLFGGYANRAHNDALEILLELGLLGGLLAGLFLFWFVRRSWVIWRGGLGPELVQLIPAAASIAIVLLLAHSLVDYPLRTSTLGAVFAFSCALLTMASLRGAPEASVEPKLATRKPAARVAPSHHQLPRERQKWGDGVDWPAAWRHSEVSERTAAPAVGPQVGDENDKT